MRLDNIIVQQSNQSRLSPLEISMTTKSLLAFNIFGLLVVVERVVDDVDCVYIVGMAFLNVIRDKVILPGAPKDTNTTQNTKYTDRIRQCRKFQNDGYYDKRDYYGTATSSKSRNRTYSIYTYSTK
jgi:hypothetical protein